MHIQFTMEQFLPILIITVVLVVNAIQARKKKMQEEREAQETLSSAKSSRRPADSRQTFSSASSLKEEMRLKSSLSPKENPLKSEKRTQSSNLRKRLETTAPEEEVTYSINAVEEARRAIIYSEIINRKY